MDSEGGDDGELDSFFEDLSTIDDLEVQDDDLSAGGGDADDFGSEDLEDELAPAAAAAAGAGEPLAPGEVHQMEFGLEGAPTLHQLWCGALGPGT